ncbi:MAG: hypothetical protein KAU28_04420, partial [Phycisphaerae bacterium]|nr:hypothetical protein [Phycisphaerae bacterium]
LGLVTQLGFEREQGQGAFPDEDMLILDDTMAQLEKLDEAIIKLEADPYSDPKGVMVKELRDRMESTRANGIAALTSAKAKRFAPGYFDVIAGAARAEPDPETLGPAIDGKGGPRTNPFTIFEGLGEALGLRPRAGEPGGGRLPVGVSKSGGRSLLLPDQPPAAVPEIGEVSLDDLAELLAIYGQSPTTQPARRGWP